MPPTETFQGVEPRPLTALPPGHPWWTPPLLAPPTDAAAGRVAPSEPPLPPRQLIRPPALTSVSPDTAIFATTAPKPRSPFRG